MVSDSETVAGPDVPSHAGAHPRIRFLAFAMVLSGASGLLYEVVWARMLGTVVGNTVYAAGIVLAATMSGLALGGTLVAPRGDRSRHPLRSYALLECGIAVGAVVFVAVVRLTTPLYIAAFRLGAEWPATVARAFVSGLALLLPTTLMGATLPLIARGAAVDAGRRGPTIARLYAANTVGAVLGALAAGFVLIGEFGIQVTLLVAMGGNLCAAVLAWLCSSSAGEACDPAPREAAAPLPRTALVLLALNGAVVLAGEVIYARSLILVLGTTTYAFAIVLSTCLLGLALGAQLGRRLVGPVDRVRWAVGSTQLLAAVSLATSVAVIGWLPRAFASLPSPWVATWLRLTISKFLLCSGALLVPMVFLGAAFPLLTVWAASGQPRLSRAVGRAVAVNTTGGAVGSLAAAFVLLPSVGLRGSIFSIAGCSAAGAAVALVSTSGERRIRAITLAAVGAAAVGVICVRTPPWEPILMGVGPSGRREVAQMLSYQEGPTATVAVYDTRHGERHIEINARNASLTEYYSRQTFQLLAHLPVLYSQAPEHALVIGFGAGITSGGLSTHPEVESIRCVELSPEVMDAGRLFAAYNGDILDDPRFHPTVGDGRNFLMATDERFGVITCDPIHPVAAGDGSLYTERYFRSALDRLEPGGVFCQWLPIHGLSVYHFQMICRTFAEAFPAAYLWFQGDYAKLIGAPSPLRIDFGELSRRLSTPAVRSSLAEVAMDDPVALVAGCALDREGLLALAGPGPTHTDDHPYVEFGGARLTKSQAAEILRLVAATVRQRNWTAANLLAPGSQDVTARVARRAEARVFYIEAREARFAADHEQEVRQYREALATDPDQGDVARDLRETADGLYAGMMSQADQARKRGDAQEARRLYMRLVGLFPDDPAVHSNLGMVLNQSDDANGALAAFDRALALDPMHPFAWAGKGMALNNLGRYDDAVAAYERALQAKPGDPKVLDLMGIAHSNAGRPAAALQCFRKAWWADPGNAEVKEHLRWAEAESGSTASGGGR